MVGVGLAGGVGGGAMVGGVGVLGILGAVFIGGGGEGRDCIGPECVGVRDTVLDLCAP